MYTIKLIHTYVHTCSCEHENSSTFGPFINVIEIVLRINKYVLNSFDILKDYLRN